MAFQGNKFIFDGVPGETYGLMLAKINNANQNAGNIGGTWKVHEDRIARRAVALDYGVTSNDALSFPITMVAMDDNHHFDRYDVAAVAGWLTGHQSFKKLIILQEDLENVYYKCRITKLEAVEVGMRIVGFTATVTCDGPYAYRAGSSFVCSKPSGGIAPTVKCGVCSGDLVGGVCSNCGVVSDDAPIVGSEFVVYNNSNVNDYYYPLIQIKDCSTNDLFARTATIVIENVTDGSIFMLENMPHDPERVIDIDTSRQIMHAQDNINLYQYWNTSIQKNFPRLVRGANILRLGGDCGFTVTISNNVPWNIGN